MKRLPDAWAPISWVTDHREFVESLIENYGGSWDEVVALTVGRTYEEFCEAFGEYFARKMLKVDNTYN